MSPEETQQVQTYIAQLQGQHAQAMGNLRKLCMAEEHSRKLAQQELFKRDQAIREIVKLVPPEPFRTQVGQIFNYYCPDFDIPF